MFSQLPVWLLGRLAFVLELKERAQAPAKELTRGRDKLGRAHGGAEG